MPDNDLENRIEEIKHCLRVNWDGLSELLNISPQGLYSYRKKKSDFPNYVLSKFYELGFNINWILTGEGEMLTDNEAGQKLKFISHPMVVKDNIEVYRSKEDSVKTSSAGEKVIIQRIENIENMLEQLIGKDIKSLNLPVAAGKIKQLANK
jgi:hypothetical protein